MLKQETYEVWADYFGSSIGVATVMKYAETSGLNPESYKKLSAAIGTNRTICKAIDTGLYQKLQREIYKLEKGDKRLKENGIVKRAWDNINGKKRINTKSTKVL
jgi:hypothetical protein